jgi:hypothetical protein
VRTAAATAFTAEAQRGEPQHDDDNDFHGESFLVVRGGRGS